MKYKFSIKTTASEFWQLSMYGIYGSILGTTNIIFTVAMILLSIRFFSGAHIVLKYLMVIAIILFPIIQPLVVYLRAKKQAKGLPKEEVHLTVDDQGIHIISGFKKEDIQWSDVRGLTKKPTLLVIYTSSQHGYVLSNKVLGEQKDDFYKYICSKMSATSPALSQTS
ncbi:MAG TPA: YcxB family protein [Thermoclostridium sp.]|jgi:hypothetical protein|nr:YcxB family protein [Thermoclostridium sp.]